MFCLPLTQLCKMNTCTWEFVQSLPTKWKWKRKAQVSFCLILLIIHLFSREGRRVPACPSYIRGGILTVITVCTPPELQSSVKGGQQVQGLSATDSEFREITHSGLQGTCKNDTPSCGCVSNNVCSQLSDSSEYPPRLDFPDIAVCSWSRSHEKTGPGVQVKQPSDPAEQHFLCQWLNLASPLVLLQQFVMEF